MTISRHRAVGVAVEIETFRLKEPFRITGHTMHQTDVLTVTLERDGCMGRGEAAGVYYRPAEDVTSNTKRIESIRAALESDISCKALQPLLAAGGARNAVDCALWDLEAKLTGRPAWQIAGLERPRPLLTTFTVSAKTPEEMAAAARHYFDAKAIKLKLTGEPQDADRVRAVRGARPDVWLGVDANQGFTRPFLETLMPVLVAANVALVEQPFPIGNESLLDGFGSPIPIAADESAQSFADLASLVGRFQTVNIKLDKCGGLTEGLAMAREAARLGLEVMVGNMLGTSLAMAPSFLLGQLCSVVDLDGPIFLAEDRMPAVCYREGMIECPEELWGAPT
jgi:L-alanine-DL-glutamate epimerase-like enolase superfamily enzyme